MTLLNTADAVYLGDTPATRVYLGDTQVWVHTPTLNLATAWWSPRHYDAANDRLLDRSGGGVHLQLGSTATADTNDPTVTTADGYHAMVFDGVDDYLRAPAHTNLDTTGVASWTYVGIHKLATATAARYIASNRGPAGTTGWALYRHNTQLDIHGHFQDGATKDLDTNSAWTGLVGTPYVFAVGRDSADGGAMVFINTTRFTLASVGAVADGNGPLNIGRYDGGSFYAPMTFYGAAWFKGLALTNSQIAAARAELFAVGQL